MSEPPRPHSESAALDPDQQRLVTEHGHVARRVQRRYRRYAVWLSHEDMAQLAHLGLVRAARAYRREEGPFAAFAWSHAIGAVIRAVDREAKERKIKDAVVDDMSTARRAGNVMTDTKESAAAELREHARMATLAFILGAATRTRAQGTETNALQAERQRIVLDAVAALRDELRQLVELHYFEELELKDVSARLGIPYGTVRRRHQEALALLRPRLEFSGAAG